MSGAVIPSQYAWLFVGALYWRAMLAAIAIFAVTGALMNRRRNRILCFGIALLLSADVLLLFLMPAQME